MTIRLLHLFISFLHSDLDFGKANRYLFGTQLTFRPKDYLLVTDSFKRDVSSEPIFPIVQQNFVSWLFMSLSLKYFSFVLFTIVQCLELSQCYWSFYCLLRLLIQGVERMCLLANSSFIVLVILPSMCKSEIVFNVVDAKRLKLRLVPGGYRIFSYHSITINNRFITYLSYLFLKYIFHKISRSIASSKSYLSKSCYVIVQSIIKMSSKANYKVYMDIQIGASAAGRIIFELFNDLTPKTSQNFRGLCTGEYGKSNNMKLHYLNTKIHKIKDGFVIQGGDISNSGGKGGFSIYGRTFVDENFSRTHSCPGLLSMANCGRNTNSSQFYITLKPCPHLDGKSVVFGQVIDGMEIVRKIAKVPIDKEDKPRYPIIIIDCGQIDDFRGFIRYDPFKKEVFQQIREARERIIRDQHAIRKLLSEGLDPNEAYNYKKRLEVCEKNLAELDRKQEQLEYEKENKEKEGGSQQQIQGHQGQVPAEKPEVLEKLRQRLGEERVNQYLQLKLKINQAQVANNKAALNEEIRQNDVNYHKMIKKNEWLKKRKEAEEEVEAKGLSKQKLYLNRNALKKQEEEKPDQSFGWNVYGEEAYFKAYHKRCQNLEKDAKVYQQQMNGGQGKPSEEALNKLQQEIMKQQQKRSSFSRRRIHDEDEKVTYINERNRVYNQKLERNFGIFASGIKTGLEMNNQK